MSNLFLSQENQGNAVEEQDLSEQEGLMKQHGLVDQYVSPEVDQPATPSCSIPSSPSYPNTAANPRRLQES